MRIIQNNLPPIIFKNRLFINAVDYLIEKNIVSSQKEMCQQTGISEATISNIRNDKKIVANKTIKKFTDTYSDIFSVDYFYGRKDEMLKHPEEPFIQEGPTQTADILELYAQRVRLVDDLRQTLKEELEEVRTIRSELLQARNDFRDATYRLTQALRTLSPNSTIDIAADEK